MRKRSKRLHNGKITATVPDKLSATDATEAGMIAAFTQPSAR